MSDAHPPLWQRLGWCACGAPVLLLLPVLKYAELRQTLRAGRRSSRSRVALGAFGTALPADPIRWTGVASWVRPPARHSIRSFAVLSLFLIAAAAVSISPPRFLLIPLVVAIALIVPLAISPLGLATTAAGRCRRHCRRDGGVYLRHLDMSTEVAAHHARSLFLDRASIPCARPSVKDGFPQPATRGGGLTMVGDRALLGTGDGHLYLIDAPARAMASR